MHATLQQTNALHLHTHSLQGQQYKNIGEGTVAGGGEEGVGAFSGALQ